MVMMNISSATIPNVSLEPAYSASSKLTASHTLFSAAIGHILPALTISIPTPSINSSKKCICFRTQCPQLSVWQTVRNMSLPFSHIINEPLLALSTRYGDDKHRIFRKCAVSLELLATSSGTRKITLYGLTEAVITCLTQATRVSSAQYSVPTTSIRRLSKPIFNLTLLDIIVGNMSSSPSLFIASLVH
jgi:hypothetical protein